MERWILGEFGTAGDMMDAARALRADGFAAIDGHTPYPVEGAEEALGLGKSPVPRVVFAAAMVGALSGYLLQWLCNAVDYPLNVGGRPLHSAPANIPITFELGVLFSALSAFAAVLAFSRLPQPWHPVFELDEFRSAGIGKFWISARAPEADARRERMRELLEASGAVVHVIEVAS